MTTSKTAFVSIALLCGLGFSVTACPASLDDRCANGACVSATSQADGGGDVVDGGGDSAIPVDPCVDTPTDPKCLDEGSALFVSAKADAASADGSRLHPFKTIGAGLAAVNGARKRVYVCEGDYVEKVSVQATVSILGGLACDWMGKAANPRIAPAKGVALSIVKGNGVVVTDMNVEGNADPLVDGDSAIGIFVSESQGVLFRQVTVKAGAATKGAIGADGDASPNHPGGLAASGLNTGTTAAAEAPSCGTCADATFSVGGKGAASGGTPIKGSAMPTVGGDNSGASGGSCVDGKPGAPGDAASAAQAAQAPGTPKATGWDSALSAKKGANGNPGQGGGGGGSTAGNGGGSGGCGGCGGTGGAPGGNGGSSLGLLSFNSDVALEDSALTAAAAGVGGNGGKGQDGQLRGGPGTGACLGGVGGYGAGGGGGGGGAGGHSAAIAHSGKAPTPKNCTLKHGLGGDLGMGGTKGASTGNAGATGNNGAKGLEADILPL